MKSIIKSTTSNHIKWYSKDDFNLAFQKIYENKWKPNKIDFGISDNIRKLIIWIIELSNEFNLKKEDKILNNKLLEKLLLSEELTHQWIIKNISNILEINNNNNIDQSFLELEKYSDEIKFKWDIKDWWKVLKVSENIQNILWYTPEDFYNWSLIFSNLIHKDDIEKIKNEVENYSKNNKKEFTQEYRLIKKDWTIITVKDRTIVSYDKNWEIEFFYWYIQDISEEKKMQNKIMNNYYTDTKTWLPNEHKLLKDIDYLKWEKLLIILKLNNFRHINSFYWFEWGNKIILKIKGYLKQKFEQLWFTIYKISQVKFWLLRKCDFDSIKRNQTLIEIKKIISSCEITSDYWQMKIKITAWLACKDNANFDNALTALYSDNNSWHLIEYNEALNNRIHENSWEIIERTKKINEWLKKDFFVPHYQWIQNNKTWKIEKYEALIRYDDWIKVESPYKFLKIAEEVNLLWKLSKKMIEIVILEMKEHNYNISINLTEQDFLNEKLIKLIINKLDYYKIEPNRLTIEVLEDITWEIDHTITNNIKILKNIWIKISIDDFWTGNSNFARLTKISPDYLKIDWSLVKWIIWENNKQNIDILRSIIEFWHLHWSQIIAEYVENKEIQDIIDILWIEYSQWYHYSKPAREIPKK